MSKVNRFPVDFIIFFTEEYPNFPKFTEKDLIAKITLSNFAGIDPKQQMNLLQIFPCEFCEIGLNTYSIEQLSAVAFKTVFFC